jgi:hypothetical protein
VSEFYGYKHWTLEEPPRCFYVGKGVKSRAMQRRSRNHKWHAVVKRYGLRVEICAGPMTNEQACAWEVETIEKMGTFTTEHSHDSSDVGCNFTHGGDGSSGCVPTAETRAKMRESHRGNATGRVNKGKSKSEAHKEAIRKALTSNPKVSAALVGNKRTLGRKTTPEENEKRAATMRLIHARRRAEKLLESKSNE